MSDQYVIVHCWESGGHTIMPNFFENVKAANECRANYEALNNDTYHVALVNHALWVSDRNEDMEED